MTYKEALRIVQTFDTGAAERTFAVSTDLVLRIVCGWKLHEPIAFLEVLEAAGMTAIAKQETRERGTFAPRVRAALTDWADLKDVSRRTGVPYARIKHVLQNERRAGRIVEKRRRVEGEPGFVYRIVAHESRVA